MSSANRHVRFTPESDIGATPQALARSEDCRIIIARPCDLRRGRSVSITFPSNKGGPIEQMQSMLAGHFVSQCLHVVAVHGIADLIVKGHRTIEQLASAADCNAPSLNRLLCTLSSMNVFTRD